MRKITTLCLAGILLASGTAALRAQEVASGIFGYCNLTMIGNSDTIVALPFARLPAVTINVASTNGNVVTASGTPGWTVNQFIYAAGTQSNTYYLRFETGALSGRYFDITSNSASALTLNLGSGSLAGVTTGDQASVIPYWTFGTVFANGNGIHRSTSTIARNSEVLLPDTTTTGVNLSPTAIYYFHTNASASFAAWRKVGSALTNRNDDTIAPNNYLTIRHKIATNTTFTSYGDVILSNITLTLVSSASSKQDNAIGLARPIPVSLADSALISSGAFTPSANSIARKDELLVFNNSATNVNKAPVDIYYYFNSAWRKVGLPATTDVGTSNVFVPGAGVLLRKAATNFVPLWQNTPTY